MTNENAPAAETEILRKDVPYGADPAWLVRRNGQLFIISTGQIGNSEPETQAFRVSEPSMKITDWDDVAGGRGLTKEQVLAELTQRPVDEDGYVLSRRDVQEAAEAAAEAAEAAAAKRQPVDPELFRRTAPQWNCVDFPDGPHYTPGGGSCSWCGMTRDQIHAEWDAREGCCGECSS